MGPAACHTLRRNTTSVMKISFFIYFFDILLFIVSLSKLFANHKKSSSSAITSITLLKSFENYFSE